MTRITPDQEHLIARFAADWADFKKEEGDYQKRLEEFMAREERALDAKRARASASAQAAVSAGVAKLRLAKAMGHNGRNMVYRLLEEPATHTAAQIAVATGEFVFDAQAGTVQVTPPRALLAPMLGSIGQSESDLDAHPELTSATFDSEGFPLTPSFTPETGRNPVVAYVLSTPSYQQKIRGAAA